MPEMLEEATIQQRVHGRLRTDIMLGRIAPGEPLTIRGLAEKLGVSAMPVREALRRLAAEQAIELLGNRRVRIPIMSVSRFEDLLAARVTLESEAAVRALPHATEQTISEMERHDAALDAAMVRNDYDNWLAANFAFHRTLYSARPDSVFLPLIESLWLQVGPFLRMALENVGPSYTVDRHVEALQALRERNVMALRIAIEADLRDGITHLGQRLMRMDEGLALPQKRGGHRSRTRDISRPPT
ncbi:transcriptional regulator, GntR family [Novosphingobium taihuense]|nr:transcriptional regulator, GntR family [Novosphingobium taihuense]